MANEGVPTVIVISGSCQLVRCLTPACLWSRRAALQQAERTEQGRSFAQYGTPPTYAAKSDCIAQEQPRVMENLPSCANGARRGSGAMARGCALPH